MQFNDFNPTNSLIIFPLNSSFILPITFLLTGSKKIEFGEYSLKSNKNFCLDKNLHKHLLF